MMPCLATDVRVVVELHLGFARNIKNTVDKFLLAVESLDLSQGDKSIIRVYSFPKLSDG